ncbi:MAG: metallophosphoesterase [Polyangiaceae bacterium]
MITVLHLSDLHLEAPLTSAQRSVIGLLFRAIERELTGSASRARAVVITGDVFDTSSASAELAGETFRDFCAGLRRATGPDVPVLVLPGNHDRRRLGLLGPDDPSLFQALARAVGPSVRVLGNQTPFLAELVPEEVHRLPFHVVAYDSTMLLGGLVSAGGLVRQEDLLQISAELSALEAASGEPPRPVLLLLHHHLVPTPVTDLSQIELGRLPPSVRSLLDRGLRSLIAHGDREELTMTALGAGTALSTLCSLGRAVLVLHGHKHYPTARLLRGLRAHEGDILIGSAGSAGRVEHWRPTDLPTQAGVWPSFNRVSVEGARVTIEAIGFSDRKPDRPFQRRRLAQAACSGARWELLPVEPGADQHVVPLRLNESTVTLVPNARDRGATFDARVDRRLQWADPGLRRPADDVVEGLPDGTVHWTRDGAPVSEPLPARVRIPPGGEIAYRIERAACRTLAEGQRRYGRLTAHEWMGLLVRHASALSRLTLTNAPATRKMPFASATALTSGEERAVPLRRSGDRLTLELADCPPLTLLRIYWPLSA